MSPKRPQIPKVEALPPEFLDQAFPGGFTFRDEANALTAYAFRNGPIENLHAGEVSKLTDDASVSRITQAEMKELMIDASKKLAALLALRESKPESYKGFVQSYGALYCDRWDRE